MYDSEIEALGGKLTPDQLSDPYNPYHALLSGITPQQAADLFGKRVIPNPAPQP